MRLIDADNLMTEIMDSDLDHLQRDDWKEVIQIVQDAPTIQPHWIPCNERPIVSGMYIVTLKDEKGLFTDTAEWNPTFGGRWQSVFYDDDAIGEYRDISNVVAWMPLPDPWEGDKDETD